MTTDFQITDVSTYRIKAVITDWGKTYSTYEEFAKAAGHPDAVLPGIFDLYEREENAEVTVLAFGMHGKTRDILFVVQNENSSDKYVINRKGLRFLPKKQKEARRIPRVSNSGVRGIIVRQAKDDVKAIEEQVFDIMAFNDGTGGDRAHQENFYQVEFVINRKKRTVVALVYKAGPGKKVSAFRRVVRRGIAKCSPDDVFNEHIGKAIAVRRAFEFPIPYGYLNAPHPTKVKDGSIIRVFYLGGGSKHFGGKVVGKDGNLYRLDTGKLTSFNPRDGDKILDDSDVY